MKREGYQLLLLRPLGLQFRSIAFAFCVSSPSSFWPPCRAFIIQQTHPHTKLASLFLFTQCMIKIAPFFLGPLLFFASCIQPVLSLLISYPLSLYPCLFTLTHLSVVGCVCLCMSDLRSLLPSEMYPPPPLRLPNSFTSLHVHL